MRTISATAACLGLLFATAAMAKEYKHQKYFEHYEGTRTCLKCHKKQANDFFHSEHYQWLGDTPDLVNSDGRRLGKMNTVNDFCTNPGPSWIGVVKNSRGDVVSKGCSKCHAGLGKLPQAEVSQEQLENIDCLICHASGYKRDLYPTDDGGWQWRPILWKNQEGLDSVAKRIGQPTRTTCLRCHAGSGGGPNFKRGDLEYALTDTTRDFDVHMGTDGADMACTDCHAGSKHRMRGRGADLFATELPDSPLSCADGECHGATPHQVEVLDRHTGRVACGTCHVPTFAKADATDMVRDWSAPAYNEEADKWGATITMTRDVLPVYAWYNGKTKAQLPGVAATVRADGSVGMMIPQGDRSDPQARISPFKLHRGKLPVLTGKDWLLPIAVEDFFADGQLDAAIKKGAHEMYGVEDAAYSWVDTVRFMGIEHGVAPAERALGCLDCHSPRGRLDWNALGYQGDPLLALLQPSHPTSQ